ncbi:MAG: hypothetical protein HFACDABA_01251 [Anaerolineales bacterium]|nr:hypothetical protein [Anaerolineales bacterium]
MKSNPPFSKINFSSARFRAALWSLIVVCVFELSIRTLVIRPAMLAFDAVWGSAPIEGACSFHALEGFGTTCYAGRNEVQTPFNSGLPVVVLGDSYTEAIQVDNAAKYVSLTEAALRERGWDVNLINLGDSNRTIADFVYMAPEIIARYAPEIVVIQTNQSGFFDSLNPRRINYFALQADGELKVMHRDRKEWPLLAQNVIHTSGLLTLTAVRWNQTTEAIPAGDESPTDPTRAAPAHLAQEVAQLVAAYPNSQIVILIIPGVPILFPDKINPGWENPNDMEVLSALTQAEKISVVYPAPAFKELYKKYGVFPRGFFNSPPNYGHLNRYGHIAVAETLTAALDALLKGAR